MSAILRIDGWSYSGKGVLLSLLDGHPELWVVPFHDLIHQLKGRDVTDQEWAIKRNREQLRLRLSQFTRYFYLQELARKGFIGVEIGKDLGISIPIQFDFARLDSALMESLSLTEPWTSHSLTTTIYSHIRRALSGKEHPAPRYFVTPSGAWRPYLSRFLDEFEQSKIISVMRPPAAIFAAFFNRSYSETSPVPRKVQFLNCLHGGTILNILEYQQQASRMAAHFPDRVMQIAFGDLLREEERTDLISRIGDFLNISLDECLREPTLLGHVLTLKGESMVSVEAEPPERLLSPWELEQVHAEVNSCIRHLSRKENVLRFQIQSLLRRAAKKVVRKALRYRNTERCGKFTL